MIFILLNLYLLSCFQIKLKAAILLGLASYGIEHIASALDSMCTWIINQYIYSGSNLIYIRTLILILTLLLTYGLCYKAFPKHLNGIYDFDIKNKLVFLISLIILLVSIVLSSFLVVYDDDRPDNYYVLVILFYNLTSSIMALYLLFNTVSLKILNNILLEKDLFTTMHSKSMDYINYKAHDLKYQLSYLLNNIQDDTEIVFQDLNKGISHYDSYIKSGNKTLDTILTRKKLICVTKNISFSIVAKGSLLDFIQPLDLYTLFGNIIDNAIEALEKNVKTEDRAMSLSISQKHNFISIHMENYTTEEANFINGLPVSTKSDLYNHGYGLPSIKYIVSQYKGALSLYQENHTFILDILFPLPVNYVD
ncbi:ATP-binding protein [Spirochaeta cellobiosiphila]|uniref:ATP-binding protein n=1 Tax=Spirochaeta cellobiosiphila TaxID=504483 RepID=UPI00146C44AB|nr:ATP-binding protein [Spirochaeta cellobiosiphila]